MEFYFRRRGHSRPLTKGLLVLLLIFTGMMFAVACSKSAARSITVSDAQIIPQPPQAGPITVIFKLADEGKPQAGAHISLEGDMTHAGMAPVFGDAKEVSPGQYQGQLTLSMGGDWVVLLHITLPDGKSVEKQIAVNGVQSK